MIRLALIGDPEVQRYSVADRLWELISVVANKKYKFSIIPLSTPSEVLAAFEAFKKDQTFVGFTITAPWQGVLAEHVDKLEKLTDLPIINTVYKNESGSVVGSNTEPLSAQLAIEAQGNLYKCKSVLVIGAGGAGSSVAHHFFHHLDKKTYLYDPLAQSGPVPKGVVQISSLLDVAKRQYDVIINTTPLGRYYFDKRVEAFTSPLDLETLSQVAHKETIIQEANYLPASTLLLQMARHLNLPVITGDSMLVFEAVETLRRYFGITLDENTVSMLTEEISAYIAEREVEILEQGDS